MKIEDSSEKKPALAGGDVSDVGNPDLVWSGGWNGVSQTVWSDGVVMVAVSGSDAVAALLASTEALGLEDADDPVASMTSTTGTEGLDDAWAAIGFAAFGVDGSAVVELETASWEVKLREVIEGCAEILKPEQIREMMERTMEILAGWVVPKMRKRSRP